MEKETVRIGIVDDHQMILDGLEKLLSSEENFKIEFVQNSAKKALELMEKKPVDLVITDVAMPEMNGAEFVQKIRALHPKIKIMVLSMYKTDLISEDDIDGYILKESSSKTILESVKKILQQKPKSQYASSTGNYHNLSKREREIVIEIGNGLSSEQIAEKFFLSYYTVETHKKNIYLKLDVKTISELIKKAMHLGIIMN
ncbi:response regulator transcription factor [Moheibacter lacus]|uniref:Response regulator transcription factor n=1 Tax=Moheibacter lacus TaxID=2745851 RepID=A0A838ZGL5_9FLAO|nr:response regulator transcription factor [Moheibacter lacus]MBA5628841.1 response regulator transcription factor [Moheibacter lacus]